jgi:hypothetical protein
VERPSQCHFCFGRRNGMLRMEAEQYRIFPLSAEME